MLAFNPLTGNFDFVGTGGAGAGVASVNGRTGAVTLTSTDVGLGSVDNTSDANKPVSTATATALTAKADLVGGFVPTAQIPAIAISDFLGTVANQVAMLALAGQKGDWAIRSDTGATWVISGTDPTQLSSWTALSYPAGAVTSVNGQTGVVVLSAANVGAQPVDGDLTALAALGGTNTIYYRSAANTWTPVTIGTGLTFATGTLTSTAGGGDVFLAGTNVFTNVQTIDMGSIQDVITDGLVMRNDTISTNAVPLQNSPVIVFEAHGWDGAADHLWEMNEQFFTYAGGNKSKFLWQFYENEGASSGEVYIDSSGSIGATGYITAGASFLAGAGGSFSTDTVQLSSATASISNVNTTVPLVIRSSNTTVNAWRFNAATALTSGNFIEGIVPNTGFTGSYLKFGRSSNGTTMTTTMFDLNAAGDLILTGSISTPKIVFPNGAIGNLAEGSDWLVVTSDPSLGATKYAFKASPTQGTVFNSAATAMDFEIKNASVDPFLKMYEAGGLYFGTVAGRANPGANNVSFGNNIGIGLTTMAASAAKAICIANGTAPSGNIGGVTIWSEGGALKCRGGTGTVTVLAPA